MKIMMLDTNVYGWAIARIKNGNKKKEAINAELLIQKLADAKDSKKLDVISSEQIFNELRREKVRKNYPEVKQLHDSLITGKVEIRKKVRELANKYLKESRERKIADIDYSDFLIIASAVVARSNYFITENRKHLYRKAVQDILKYVNEKNRLFNTEIIDCEKALKLLF